MQITPEAVQALADRRIGALMVRAREHCLIAVKRPGDPRNFTLASLIDKLADEGANITSVCCDVLELAGAHAASAELTAKWRKTASELHGLGLECRTHSLSVWSLGPAAVQHAQVAA